MAMLRLTRAHHRLALLFALTGLAAPAAADIYKCRLADGRIEISNSPCTSGSGTLSSRPDDTVPEASRQQAERDVERMRNFVDKREAAQRAEAAAERQAQIAAQQRSASSNHHRYGDPDACLRELSNQALEANQRAALEAECRSLVRPPAPATPAPTYVPLWVGPVPHHPRHQPPHQVPPPPAQLQPNKPNTATIAVCPPNQKNCRR